MNQKWQRFLYKWFYSFNSWEGRLNSLLSNSKLLVNIIKLKTTHSLSLLQFRHLTLDLNEVIFYVIYPSYPILFSLVFNFCQFVGEVVHTHLYISLETVNVVKEALLLLESLIKSLYAWLSIKEEVIHLRVNSLLVLQEHFKVVVYLGISDLEHELCTFDLSLELCQ